MQSVARVLMFQILAATWLHFGAPISVAHACSTHGSVTGATLDWLPASARNGIVHGLLTLETVLVPPSSATTCAAGIGVGSDGNPKPGGLAVVGMAIVVVDPNTGGRTPLQAFSFEPNSNTSNGLAMGSGSSSPPDSNPLFGGSAWFGFASRVEPFVPPMLGPDQFLAFQFTVEVDESLLPLSLAAQFAGGEGMGDGAPDFGGAHPVRYFTAANQSVSFTAPSEPVPALSAAAAVLAILSLGAVGFGSFRRLLAKGKPDYRETNSA